MLEEISESIHARRQVKRKINVLREPGVGAEFEINENMADIGNYGFLFTYNLIFCLYYFASCTLGWAEQDLWGNERIILAKGSCFTNPNVQCTYEFLI